MPFKNDYITLCQQQSDLPLFHKDWWLDITCKDWGVAIVKRGNIIAGVWPYSVENKLGITISRNPALTPYMGPHIFFPPSLKESRRDNYEHEVITGLIAKLPPYKVWDMACRPCLKQAGLFKANRFNYNFRQTFIMSLCEPEEVIFSRLHEEFRRSVRKCADEMVIAHEPGALSVLYEYQVATLKRKGVNISYSYKLLQQLFNACEQRNAAALWVARKDGQIQAILWNLWDDVRAYYLVGAKNQEVKNNYAMPALLWHAIKHSKALGKLSMDFEGSMIPGVERFFRNFGATRYLYPVLTKNTSPVWRLIRLIRH